ncbi:DNA polymerase III subunit gamma/tau [Candidatus Nephthysia bennettiae]|uniref:DNA polymerase III subunit gamma/tau n=1 Tax=Candidatus Nephthysia bennettiae TaxID=3127016 RepID=A0A934KAZ5_9BACT|nr:DNA polymerase III subunit gamma/tau [Candidatus Dormibacteraeota bacterium]MBJ7611670.1 DNA polymerase III subunit gamma/tau [Candidatus Dormibacteraeota bacterium]
MSYQTLYRKYRSQTFADLVGQEATSRALQGAIATDHVAHAYLFSGTRGTGKTSTARLLAKAINCLRRPTGEAEPCNECESCVQVQTGSALDLIEIDAASNRGIDEIRDLREKVNLSPALGRRKVYIIDEAHMLTTEAFNALLKTLEEPPEHVVFVLCTTEANKVPLTVLGRCQQFVFRRHNEEQIAARLRHIAVLEGIEVDDDALRLLARVAQGSMRDAIGLLDQLVPLADGPITVAGARELLGIADPAALTNLFDLVQAGRPVDALQTLGAIYEAGGELRQVVRGLMERCRDLLVAAIEEGDTIRRDRLSGVLEALLHLDGEVRRHAEPRFLVEATLVRLAVQDVAAAGSAASASAAAGTAVPAAAPERTALRTAADGPAAEPSSAPVAGAVVARPAPAPEMPALVEVAAAAPSAPAPSPSAPATQAVAAAGSAPAAGGDVPDFAAGWQRLLEQLSPKTRAYFRAARAEAEGGRLVLFFPYGFHHKMAMESAGQVEPLVKSWLGGEVSLDLRLQESGQGLTAPASVSRPLAPEEDPLIKAAERKLEGRVVRVRPLKEVE